MNITPEFAEAVTLNLHHSPGKYNIALVFSSFVKFHQKFIHCMAAY